MLPPYPGGGKHGVTSPLLETMSQLALSRWVLRPATTRFGYGRVSTLEQDEALQHDALAAAGCDRIFVDKASGELAHRPALDALLEQLRPRDTVVVWRLDRLGRPLRHLIDTLDDFERRGVAFLSLTEHINTSTPGGKPIPSPGPLAEFRA